MKKVNLIIIVIIIVFISLLYYLKVNRNMISSQFPVEHKEQNNAEISTYNIGIYGYYESEEEDPEVKNYYETKVEKLTTIEVEHGNNIGYALKKIKDNCPGKKEFCEKFEYYISNVTAGLFYYNEQVKTEIQKENEENKKFWICYNNAKTEKEKTACGTEYYFFEEHSKESKIPIGTYVTSSFDIIIPSYIFK